MVLQAVPAGVGRHVFCRPFIKQIANVAVAWMHSMSLRFAMQMLEKQTLSRCPGGALMLFDDGGLGL